MLCTMAPTPEALKNLPLAARRDAFPSTQDSLCIPPLDLAKIPSSLQHPLSAHDSCLPRHAPDLLLPKMTGGLALK